MVVRALRSTAGLARVLGVESSVNMKMKVLFDFYVFWGIMGPESGLHARTETLQGMYLGVPAECRVLCSFADKVRTILICRAPVPFVCS